MKCLWNTETQRPEHPHLTHRSVGEHCHAEVARRWPRIARGTYSISDAHGVPICGRLAPGSRRVVRILLKPHLLAMRPEDQ